MSAQPAAHPAVAQAPSGDARAEPRAGARADVGGDAPVPRPWPRRLSDALLSTEPLQRLRLAQAALAMGLLAAGVAAMHYFVAAGMADAALVWAWTAVSLGGMAVFFALIRSGWSRRCADPSLTEPQMLYALACGAAAYAMVGAGRGGVFPIVMVVLAFGMFQLRPAQVRRVSLCAVALFGAVMALMAWRRPAVYAPAVELGHFLMVATMMPAMSLLSARLSQLRQRLQDRKQRLAQALARIQELATRDELTGLPNRRQMLARMAQEHQRCVRSGHTFCLAVLDLDAFKAVNDRLGHAAGDARLQAASAALTSTLRASDVLARWGGDEFVLLLPDTRLALARVGVERLREAAAHAATAGGDGGVATTLSAGVAEHRAGETVAQTLARADEALRQAKTAGRNRVACG